jgi:hypothetical protein
MAALMRLVIFLGLSLAVACGGPDSSEVGHDGGASNHDAGFEPSTDGGSTHGRDAGLGDAGHSSREDAGPGDGDAAADEPCNGNVALCDRRFDEVVYPATHNAHSAQEYGYTALNANQISGIEKQLADGVRGLLMDVYDNNGEHVFCHGTCALGHTPHVDGLNVIKSFLDANPREVITIIYEDHLAVDQIAADYASIGLDAYTYTHPAGSVWPTLRALIDANTRLVVTLENGRAPPAWVHNVWDEAWDTPYGPTSQDAFSCDLNRGAREHALFLLNHWQNTGLGLPSEDAAKQVNTFEFLHGRAVECQTAAGGDLPNFVAVDFYEHGDLFAVVKALNGL